MENIADNELDIILAFKRRVNETAAARKNFKDAMDANLISLNSAVQRLVTTSSVEHIVDELKKIDIRTTSEEYFARIQFIMHELPIEGLKMYYNYVLSKYSEDELNATVKSTRERVEEFQKADPRAVPSKEFKAEIDELNFYIQRRKSMVEFLIKMTMDGVFGDTTLNDKDMAGVYFSFNSSVDSTTVATFIKEIRSIQSESVSKIRKVSFCTKTVNESTLTTVLFFFDNSNGAAAFHALGDRLEAIYDKYLRFTQKNAAIEPVWGLIDKYEAEYINANLPHTDPLSGMYVDPNAPVPLSPTSEMAFVEMYSKPNPFTNYKGSDFVFLCEEDGAEESEDEGVCFMITTKEYWEAFKCIYSDHIDIGHIVPEDQFEQVAEAMFLFEGSVEDGREILLGLGLQDVTGDADDDDDDCVDLHDTTAESSESVFGANEAELIEFAKAQYHKVLSWNKNPDKFSVYRSGTEWKLILTSEFEGDVTDCFKLTELYDGV
jgi:hypothetical protein